MAVPSRPEAPAILLGRALAARAEILARRSASLRSASLVLLGNGDLLRRRALVLHNRCHPGDA